MKNKLKLAQVRRYLLTVFVMALATILQWQIQPIVETAPFLLYYPAIVVAALYGSGSLGVLLASLLSQYFFVPPIYSLAVTWPGPGIRQAIFILSGIMIVTLSNAFKKAKMNAQESANEARLNSEWLNATLKGIGDAVIATDRDGKVNFMNAVAESLTGWSQKDAKGVHLDIVFKIISEVTRKTVESPVTKVIQAGVAVGLANHTALIRKDGSEITIEDSAAPIRNEQGVLSGVVLVFRDASGKRAVEAKLEFERHQLETIFKESPAAMALWTGPNFVFEKVNPHYQAIFPGRQLQGKPFLEALPEFKGQPFQDLLTKVLETGEPFVGKEVLARHPRYQDGPLEDVYYDFTYMRVTDAEGQPYGVYDHAIDVTDKVITKQNLINALRARDELLSICSHELRTPVSSMKLATQMFRRGLEKGDPKTTSPDRVRRMVEQSDRQLQKLTRLIEEMLDFSRISGGRLQISKEAFDLADLVTEVLDRIRPQFESIGSTISLEKSVHVVGKWDRFRLEQVIINLISNALKYGADKPVRVNISQDKKYAFLSVIDQGLGIPTQDQTRIFKPYERAVSVNNISGLGLGLYISHQIIEAHGGKIEVKSTQGAGSTFTVILPIKKEMEK